jgi:hypothetical protein
MIRNVSLVNGQTDRLALPYTSGQVYQRLQEYQVYQSPILVAIGFIVARSRNCMIHNFGFCNRVSHSEYLT